MNALDNSHCFLCNEKFICSDPVSKNRCIQEDSNPELTIFQFLQSISNFNNVDISIVPENVCGICYQGALLALDFQTLCNKSAEKLSTHVENIVKEEVFVEDNFKEEITEVSDVDINESDNNEEDACIYSEERSSQGEETIISNSLKQREDEVESEDVEERTNIIMEESEDVSFPDKEILDESSSSDGDMDYFNEATQSLVSQTPEEIKKEEARIKRQRYQYSNRKKCTICSKIFARSYLPIHMREHTGERPFKCKLCPKEFKAQGGLMKHTWKHTGERPYLCTICGVGLIDKGALQSHYYQHTNEKPFECEICGKAFRTKGQHQRHFTIHSDAKPFACKECPKTFRLHHLLKQHMVTHATIKPIECLVCGRRFTQRHALRSHQAKSCKGYRDNDDEERVIAN